MTIIRIVAVPTSRTVGHRNSQEHVHHGFPLIDERQAELPTREITDVVDELGRQGLVQAEFAVSSCCAAWRELDPLLTREQPDRIARHDAEQEEVEHQDEDEGDERLQDLLDRRSDGPPTSALLLRRSTRRHGASVETMRARCPHRSGPTPAATSTPSGRLPSRCATAPSDRTDGTGGVRVPPEHDAVGLGPPQEAGPSVAAPRLEGVRVPEHDLGRVLGRASAASGSRSPAAALVDRGLLLLVEPVVLGVGVARVAPEPALARCEARQEEVGIGAAPHE